MAGINSSLKMVEQIKDRGHYMKKKVLLIISILIVVSLLFLPKFSDGRKTIEEAINIPGSSPINIIHEEKNNKGSIVFGYTSTGNNLYTAIVRKGIGGYKMVYSGMQSDVKTVLDNFGISYIYLPRIENTALPIYFGMIGNPDINEIKIIEKKRKVEGKAKIIDANGKRIWIIYMDGFQGSDFDIIGLSKSGEELTKISSDIYPHYVEQKPLKGYQ